MYTVYTITYWAKIGGQKSPSPHLHPCHTLTAISKLPPSFHQSKSSRCTGAIIITQESSFQYWPDVGEKAEFGEYTVDLISEEILEGFTIRTLSVLNKSIVGST